MGVNFASVWGNWKLCWGVLPKVRTWGGGGVVLTKNSNLWILTTKHQLKSKLAWPVCQKKKGVGGGRGAIDFWWGGNKNLVGKFFQIFGWWKFLVDRIFALPLVGKTNKTGGLGIWNFQRCWRNSKWIFQGVD